MGEQKRRNKDRKGIALYDELAGCPYAEGKELDVIIDFLVAYGINSFMDVDVELQVKFYEYVQCKNDLSFVQKKLYASFMEVCKFVCCGTVEYEELLAEAKKTDIRKDAIYRKTLTFLMLLGVHRIDEIVYDTRKQFQRYLLHTGFKKDAECLKVLDRLKLHAIKTQCEANPLKRYEYSFEEKEFYLGYHPDYKTALKFYFVRNKEELLFDFSLKGSLKIKRQIFSMVNHVLKLECNNKNRREMHLVPLKLLYLYCIEHGVSDLEQMELSDREGFRRNIDGHVGSKTNCYMQIVDRTLKFLFCQAPETNWKANVWYLERFHMGKDRINPANPVVSMHFYLIHNKRNRKIFKEYMKYMIGLTDRSVWGIRSDYYRIYEFLQYLDQVDVYVEEVNKKEIDGYLKREEVSIKEGTFNQKVEGICKLFYWMMAKGWMNQLPLQQDYYLKKAFGYHHDRIVDSDILEHFLDQLQYFPKHLRLMYLNLFGIGLRVNEVCCLKGDAYFWKGQDAWIRVHQYKMRQDKIIPIPEALYRLMRDYILEREIAPDEYIFYGSKGGPYRTGTFCMQMKKYCEKYNLQCGTYLFRSHDYRHGIGTLLFKHGVSIQAIRDYLGHNSEDMTKQYIDYLPAQLEEANLQYFEGRKGEWGE